MFGLMPMVVRAQIGAPPPPPPPPTPVAPAFTNDPATSVYVGATYTYTPTTSGTPAPTLSTSALPAWLSWSGGTLSGVPPLSAATIYGPGNESLYIDGTNGVSPDARKSWNLAIAVAPPTGALRVWDSETRPQPDLASPVNQNVITYIYPGLRAITARIGYKVLSPTAANWGLALGPENAGFLVKHVDAVSNYTVSLGIGGPDIDTGIPHAGVEKLAMAVVGCTDGVLCVLKSASQTWTHLVPIGDLPSGITYEYMRADTVDDADIQAVEYWTGAPMTAAAAYPSSAVVDWLAAAVAP